MPNKNVNVLIWGKCGYKYVWNINVELINKYFIFVKSVKILIIYIIVILVTFYYIYKIKMSILSCGYSTNKNII